MASVDINKYDEYFYSAGEEFGVRPEIIKNIALTENRRLNPNIVRKNSNGTYDIGLMQINTIRLKELKKIGITKSDLKDPRESIRAAAYIISKIVNRYGDSDYAIATYHSKTAKYKKRWLKRFKKLKDIAYLDLSSQSNSEDKFVFVDNDIQKDKIYVEHKQNLGKLLTFITED